ncbi:uncharacterized protein METZ01_LOCUS97679 [marine metagenome]|uniref:Uncharacterized protein n=1 Tax=marine metagenome TaxID=408172 RepID=A0A381VX31_9ZZZZ
MLGMVKSLNVSVVNTVFLFEVQHQRETSILYDKTKVK